MEPVEDARQRIGVAGVVADGGGRILLIKTEKAGWELPGGRVEPGEDLVTALQREVMEEACCEVEVGRLTGVASILSARLSAPGVTMFTFLCRHTGGIPYPADDSLEAGWFDPEVAVQLVTHPTELVRLKDALSESEGVCYRAYRRLPDSGEQSYRYEMIRLHDC